jgi:hypothetical protein
MSGDGNDEAEIDRILSIQWFKLRATQLRFDKVVRGQHFVPQPERPRPDLKNIAELGRLTLRLGRPIPQWALFWLFDLMDPPANSINDWRLAVDENDRGRGNLNRSAAEVETLSKIAEAMDQGVSVRQAILKATNGDDPSSGYRLIKRLQPVFDRLRPQRRPKV